MKFPLLPNAWTLALTALLAFVGLCAPAFAGTPNILLVMPIQVVVDTDPPAVAPAVTGSFTYDVSCVRRVSTPPTFSSPALTLTQPTVGGNAQATLRVYDSGTCTVSQTGRPTAPVGYTWSSTPPQISPATYAGFPSTGSAFIDITAPLTTVTNTLLPDIPITLVYNPPGAGVVTCTPNPVPYGNRSVCNLTSTNPGYTFLNMTGCNGGSDGSFYTSELTAPCTITANFQPDPIAITTTVSPLTQPASGTLSCNPNPGSFGSTSLCSAAPSPGYSLVGIAGCNGSSAASPMTTGALSADCEVTATFALTTYIVTAAANPSNAGVASCASPVNEGATSLCSVTSTTAGYTFAGWTTSGCGAASSAATYTTIALTAACTVTAAFTLNSYVVTAAANPTNAGVVSCTSPVNHGATSLCSVTSTTAGYTFAGWTTSGCGAASSAAIYTTNALTAACTVTATFTLNRYVVTAAANPTNAGVASCASPVNHGATSLCSVTSTTAGYTFAGWTTSGCGAASSAATYTTNALTAACTVTAAFTLNQYVVTAAANPAIAGTVTCASPVNSGATSLCSVTATTAGYTFTGWTTSGCGAASSAATYTTNALTANCSVTGTFALNTYTVTGVANPTLGGTVSCASPVAFNTTSSCTATANTGYTLTSISGCGGTAAATSPYSTGAVTANCTVNGNFALNTYVITTVASPAAGGTLTCAPNPVAHGSTASCTATPNAGYSISPITGTAAGAGAGLAKALSGGIGGCGGAPTTTNPFTTAAVTAPCTVTANFVLNTFPVSTSVVVLGGGTLTCTPATVAFGATTSCTATANAGFTLTGISGCGGVPSTTNAFTTGAVTAACTVTARFAAAAVIEPALPVPALDPWLIALSALLTALCGAGMLTARRRAARGKSH